MPGSATVGTRRAPRLVRGWQWGSVAVATAVGSLGIAAPAGAATQTALGAPTKVIVQAEPGLRNEAERAVQAAHGRVERELAIINGFTAVVPAGSETAIEASTAVRSVSVDAPLTPMSEDSDSGSTNSGSGSTNASTDLGSMSAVTRIIGAQKLWEKGFTGKGVDVALIDTGVAPVPGLTDRVVDGPDLSFDYQAGAPEGVDAFGHGTHMAGIIAGRDSGAKASAAGCTTCLNKSGYSDTTKFVGVAPDARIVNVKVGAFNGATDVSQVIAGIDWVVQHRNDNGMNIKVLNLSFGTDSAQSYRIDPLSYAAEVAWDHGIVVVAAAGNDGENATRLSDPAYNPTILAVGAYDSDGSLDPDDGFVAPFTNGSNTSREIDVVAPGAHILSLRNPGSFVDVTNPASVVGTRFTRGSGTSQAAAVTSGFIATLAQRFPNAKPDQLKKLVLETADDDINRRGYGDDDLGILDGDEARDENLPKSVQTFAAATGTGSLEAARGTSHVVSDDQELTGEQDIFGNVWDGRRWSTASANGTSWDGGYWNGRRWSGDGWNGQRWSNANWEGDDWAGRRWSGQRWSDVEWDGARWSGARWSGARWSGARWSGARWSADAWTAGWE